MNKLLSFVALTHCVAFACWGLSPVSHESKLTGNWMVDYVFIPVGAISLVLLVLIALLAPVMPKIIRWMVC